MKRLRGERLFPTFPRDFRIGERGRPARDAMPEDAGGARIPAERRRARPAILRAAAVRAHWSFGICIFDVADRPPIFLAKPQSDLAARGVQSVQKEFARAANVLALNENIIINCTGLGAGTIWQDRLVYPVKGQLVHLPPQPNLQYLYSGLSLQRFRLFVSASGRRDHRRNGRSKRLRRPAQSADVQSRSGEGQRRLRRNRPSPHVGRGSDSGVVPAQQITEQSPASGLDLRVPPRSWCRRSAAARGWAPAAAYRGSWRGHWPRPPRPGRRDPP